jgi:hypothetical protein
VKIKTIRWVIGVVLLLLGLILIVWLLLPDSNVTQTTSKMTPTISGQSPEERTLKLVYPQKIKVGCIGIVQINLLPINPSGNPGNNESANGIGKIHKNNLIETRLEFPGVRIFPNIIMRQPIVEGIPVRFVWNITPILSGNYRGTIWLYEIYQNDETNNELRKVLATQRIQIIATSFFGLNCSYAKIVSVFCIGTGLLLLIDWVAKNIERMFIRKKE